MAATIWRRDDFDAPALRALAKASRDPDQLRRLLSVAEIFDGGSRGDAARLGGVGLQTVRDWVLRFNERGPEGLIDPGQLVGQRDDDQVLVSAGEKSPQPGSKSIRARCQRGQGGTRTMDQKGA